MLAALAAVLLLLAAPRARALTAREVIDEAQARNGFATWTDRRSVVHLEASDGAARGVTREADVWEKTDPHGEHRTYIEFTAPADAKGTRFLHVSPRGVRDQWWMWTPATRRARKLGGTGGGLQRDEIFTGRALNYEDLEQLVRIQQWTEAEATASLDGEGPCGEAVCDRVRLVPAAGNDEFPCAGYRLWYTRGERLLARAELDDPDGRLMKTITCDGWFPTGRYRTARTCIVQHVNGTRATITVNEVAYDAGLGDDLFGLAHLEGQ